MSVRVVFLFGLAMSVMVSFVSSDISIGGDGKIIDCNGVPDTSCVDSTPVCCENLNGYMQCTGSINGQGTYWEYVACESATCVQDESGALCN